MIRGVRCGKGSARGELGGSNAGLCTCPGQPLTGSGIFNFELLQGGGLCLYKEKIGSGQKRASTGVGMGQKGGGHFLTMLPHFPHIGVQFVSNRMGKSEFLVPRSDSPLTFFFAGIHTLAGWLSGKTVVSPVGGWVSCEQGPRQGHGSCHCTSCPTQPPPSIPTNIGQCPKVSEQGFWACLILPNAFQPTVYRTQVFQSSGPNVTLWRLYWCDSG